MKHRRFIAALLCGTMFYGLPTTARAEPISTAIGLTALLGGGAIAGAVGGAIIGGVVSVGASLLARVFSPAPSASNTTSATGTQANVQYGASVPRDRIFGTCATAGQLVYWNLSGADNVQLDLAFAVGDGPHDSIAGMYVNGNAVTLTPSGTGDYIVNEFVRTSDSVALMRVAFHQGFEGQAADAALVASSNPVGRWTNNSTLSGIAYVRVTMYYDKDIFSTGMPTFLFVIKGALLYDPRFDSTVGGSGSQLWGDPTTWVWSDNPAVGLYNYQRGLYLNNELIIGEGLGPQDLILGMYAAAANDCDGAVSLAAGGTEKRYRVNMNVGADKTYSQAIQGFLDAMAGRLLESAGSFGPVAGVTQTVVLPTINDTDLIQGSPIVFAKKRTRADLFNAVFGSYCDTTQQYQSIPFPPRTSTSDETEDGERLATTIDYPQVQSPTQAQRLGEITRRLSRSQATATITVGFKFVVAEPGDWVIWTSARYGTLTWRVEATTINAEETITLALREISSSVFAWNFGADELSPTSPGNLPGYSALASTVSGFALVPEQIDAANGLTIPALLSAWSPITDQSITSVIVQYRIQGDTNIKQVSFDVPAPLTGYGLISEAIQAATVYEARATITTNPHRTTSYTGWVVQQSPLNQVVATANEALLAKYNALSAEIKYQVTTALEKLDNNINNVNAAIASLSAINTSRTWLDKQAIRRDLSSVSGAANAKITELFTVSTNLTAALAQTELELTTGLGAANARLDITNTSLSDLTSSTAASIATLTSNFGSVSANLSAEIETRSTADGALSASITTLSTQTNNSFASVNATLIAQSTATTALSGRLDTFGTTLNGHTASINAFTGSIDGSSVQWGITGTIDGTTGGLVFTGIRTAAGVNYALKLRGDLMIDGTLTGTKFVAGSINTLQLAVNSVDINQLVKGAATQVFGFSSTGSISLDGTVGQKDSRSYEAANITRDFPVGDCAFLVNWNIYDGQWNVQGGSNFSVNYLYEIAIKANGVTIGLKYVSAPSAAGSGHNVNSFSHFFSAPVPTGTQRLTANIIEHRSINYGVGDSSIMRDVQVVCFESRR